MQSIDDWPLILAEKENQAHAYGVAQHHQNHQPLIAKNLDQWSGKEHSHDGKNGANKKEETKITDVKILTPGTQIDQVTTFDVSKIVEVVAGRTGPCPSGEDLEQADKQQDNPGAILQQISDVGRKLGVGRLFRLDSFARGEKGNRKQDDRRNGIADHRPEKTRLRVGGDFLEHAVFLDGFRSTKKLDQRVGK